VLYKHAGGGSVTKRLIMFIWLGRWWSRGEMLIYKSGALDLAFRKFGLDRIYNAYSNGHSFKYYVSIVVSV